MIKGKPAIARTPNWAQYWLLAVTQQEFSLGSIDPRGPRGGGFKFSLLWESMGGVSMQLSRVHLASSFIVRDQIVYCQILSILSHKWGIPDTST